MRCMLSAIVVSELADRILITQLLRCMGGDWSIIIGERPDYSWKLFTMVWDKLLSGILDCFQVSEW